ncbi:MAG TPA: VWA domain-containing protein [Saprospiraceae bacterium]|nr:VWA domain-containing protein [Saprospiraceae bacterium]
MALLKSGIFWLVLSSSLVFLFSAGPNRKKAYKEHYEGSLLYTEGHIKRANQKFKRAYQILPDNFYFALAYGLSEGRLGNPQNGLEVIQQANRLLKRGMEDYYYKQAIGDFMAGMVYAYNQDYDAAFRQIQSALTSLPDSTDLKSIMLNNLGYLQLLNQSKNQHETSDTPAHLHLREHDLEAAHLFFQKALEQDPDNGTAYYNYKMLSDTLGLSLEFNPPSSEAKQRAQTDQPTFLYMDEHIRRTLELDQYQELVFMVDVSGSMVAEQVLCMADDRFGVMKTLSRKIVAELPEHIQLGIGTIGGDCPDAPAKWKPSGTIDKKELDTDLRFLIPDGTTPLLTRLLSSPELFSDSTQSKKSIFLISDGANTCRESGLDICAFAEELAQRGITVNVLTFLNSSLNNTSAFSEYICLADNTNGKVIYMDNLRCYFETFDFDLTSSCQLTIPKFEKSYCWGQHIETLWMFSPEG